MTIESLPTFTKPARQRWESIPADIRQRLLSNVWCGQCRHETTITNFSGTIKGGDLLQDIHYVSIGYNGIAAVDISISFVFIVF